MAWTFHNPLGTLQCGTLTGQVDVTQPQLGLHQLRIGSTPLAGRICGVGREASSASATAVWPAKLADAYIRGDDLVATYQATDEWPFAPQVYWRADTPAPIDEVLGSVSLLVSVSTQLLDTHPRICALTEFAANDVLHVTPSDDEDARTTSLTGRRESVLHPNDVACCLLWRLPGGQLSYAEIVPASDFRQLSVRHDKDGTCHARWELIADFLEKGVIRRTRLGAAFLPRQRDLQLAAACCRHFAARPLPLAT